MFQLKVLKPLQNIITLTLYFVYLSNTKIKMNLKHYLTITLIFFITNFSLAQKTAFKNEVGLHAGYNFGLYKNLTLSPVSLYKYQSLIYEGNYLRHTKKNRIFEIRIQHWNSKLKSEKIPELNLNYISDRLSLSYLYSISNKNKWIIHSGFFSNTIGASYGEQNAFEFQQKLALTGRIRYQLNNKQYITSQLSVPFLLFVKGNLDNDIYSFSQYQGYIFNIDYHYSLSNRFSLVSQFHSRYDRIQSTNVFRELQNKITLGINYKF